MKDKCFLLTLLLILCGTSRAATTINFDYWTDGSPISAPTDAPFLSITDEFAEWGILFESTTHIVQHSTPSDLDTPPNCLQADHVSGSELWEDSITLDARFVYPTNPSFPGTVTWVSFFQDRGAQSGGGTFIAYDINGNEVINESFNTSGKTFHTFDDWGYVGEIHRIYIGYCKDGLDDLTFPTPVPEPACGDEIEDSDIHEWLYSDPDFEGTLTDPANAFDGDWDTYAEVRSNGNGIHAIIADAQETWSVPIGSDLEFNYKIESVDVYQQAIYIRFWNPDTSDWDIQKVFGQNQEFGEVLDGLADEAIPVPALYVDENGYFKSSIILLNKWNTNAWSRLYETSVMVPCEPAIIEVAIDIKPQSCPNPLNVKSKGKGVLPVAILGSEEFDVSTIDVATILLEGLIRPSRSSYEDVASTVDDGDECECTTEVPDDYYIDLTLKFDTRAIVAAIGEVTDGEELVLSLTGALCDGTRIVGEDCIVIRAKSKSKPK